MHERGLNQNSSLSVYPKIFMVCTRTNFAAPKRVDEKLRQNMPIYTRGESGSGVVVVAYLGHVPNKITKIIKCSSIAVRRRQVSLTVTSLAHLQTRTRPRIFFAGTYCAAVQQ